MHEEQKDHLPVKVTVVDMIRCLISISYASCCRLLKQCIHLNDHGVPYVHPLPDTGQGTILQAHATPMPCCSADVTSIAFMNTCLTPSTDNSENTTANTASDASETLHSDKNEDNLPSNRYCRIHDYARHEPVFKGNFFRSVMSAIYGQTRGLTEYFESGKAPNGKLLPSHMEAAVFAAHIDETCDDNLAKHYRSQYKGSIPDPLKQKKAQHCISFED